MGRRHIDGGTTKDSPSKLKPIDSKSDVGREQFEVKHHKYGGGKDFASDDDHEELIKRLPVIEFSFNPELRQLKPTHHSTAKLPPCETCGPTVGSADGGGGTKNDLQGKGEGGARGGENNDTRSAKDYNKTNTAKKSPPSLLETCITSGLVQGIHQNIGGIDFDSILDLSGRYALPDNETSLKDEYFKIKTFDLRGGDGGEGGCNGGDSNGGVGGQGGGAGGVAK